MALGHVDSAHEEHGSRITPIGGVSVRQMRRAIQRMDYHVCGQAVDIIRILFCRFENYVYYNTFLEVYNRLYMRF